MIEIIAALLAGTAGGAVLARRRTPKIPTPPAPVCACEHGFGSHDADGCHAVKRVLAERGNPQTMKSSDQFGDDINVIVYDHERWADQPCSCRRYVGPEPLPSYYDQGIASLDAPARKEIA